MPGIEGKAVVITGASSGLGEATARLLAAKRAKVALGARRKDRLDAVVSDIETAGGQAVAQTTDVTKRSELESLKLDHMNENFDTAGVQLTAADVKEVDDGFSKIDVQGARAPEALMARHDIGANLGTSSEGGHGMSPLPGMQSLRAVTPVQTKGNETCRSELLEERDSRSPRSATGAWASTSVTER